MDTALSPSVFNFLVIYSREKGCYQGGLRLRYVEIHWWRRVMSDDATTTNDDTTTTVASPFLSVGEILRTGKISGNTSGGL